jgi:hypothetical protein
LPPSANESGPDRRQRALRVVVGDIEQRLLRGLRALIDEILDDA